VITDSFNLIDKNALVNKIGPGTGAVQPTTALANKRPGLELM